MKKLKLNHTKYATKHICIIIVVIFLFTFTVLTFLLKLKFFISASLSLLPIALVLGYSYKRHNQFSFYIISIDVYPSEYGDTVEVGIIGVTKLNLLTLLKAKQIKTNCILDLEKTNYLLNNIHPLVSVQNLIVCKDLTFDYYDDIVSAFNTLYKLIRLDIKNNLPLIRTSISPNINNKKANKYHSGFFGIFKSKSLSNH